MPKAQIYPLKTIVKTPWTGLARVQVSTGDYAKRADFTEISFICVETAEGTTHASGTYTIADVIFDTLQNQDPRWEVDEKGFNFAGEIPAAGFPNPGEYRIEYKFTPVNGEPFKIIFQGPAIGSLTP